MTPAERVRGGSALLVPLASRRLLRGCDQLLGTEVSVGKVKRRVRGGWARVTTAAAVLLVVSVWAALPATAGDPLGEDADLWFTENANPGRIGKIGAGCVPPRAPVETQPRFTG